MHTRVRLRAHTHVHSHTQNTLTLSQSEAPCCRGRRNHVGKFPLVLCISHRCWGPVSSILIQYSVCVDRSHNMKTWYTHYIREHHIYLHVIPRQQPWEFPYAIHMRRYLRSIEAIQWSQGHRRRLGDRSAHLIYCWTAENRPAGGRARLWHDDARRTPSKAKFLESSSSREEVGTVRALHESFQGSWIWKLLRVPRFEVPRIRVYRSRGYCSS